MRNSTIERNAPQALGAMPSFDAPNLVDTLAAFSAAMLDELPFGVVAMEPGGKVVAYNAFEQRLAGLADADVIGRDFFTEVAPCTNNYLVRERFVDAWQSGTVLDEVVPYTFSYRMKPTRVVLRLLARPDRGFLLVRLP